MNHQPSPVVKSSQAEDFEKTPVEKVLAILAVSIRPGLSSSETRARLAKYRPNAIIEREISRGASDCNVLPVRSLT
jgi:hypothetical protein